ncbi:hypothetical protein ACFVRW_23725 [Bacillus subtilis]
MGAFYPAFNAPSANEAYADAPDLATEAAEVAGLLAVLEEEGRELLDVLGAGAFLSERREVLLRAAAVADRQWWATRTDEALAEAERAAEVFVLHEGLYSEETAGPIEPESAEWDAPGGRRAYVRQEYWSWYNIPPGCGNCPPDDPCPWHQR